MATGGRTRAIPGQLVTLAAADTADPDSGPAPSFPPVRWPTLAALVRSCNQRLIVKGWSIPDFDIARYHRTATSVARPLINGTRPTLNGTVTLATGSTARGFNVSNATVNGVNEQRGHGPDRQPSERHARRPDAGES